MISKHWGILWSGVIGLSTILVPAAMAAVNQPDLAAIAQMREAAVKALNTRDFAKVKPLLHPDFTITTVDNRVFHTAEDFEKYWTEQLSGPIKTIAMELTVDPQRVFLSPETEVAYGDAIASFSFADGNVAKMTMRWTAVVQKFQGKWTLQSIHFSSNLLDNPVLTAAQQGGRMIAIATAAAALLLGAGGMWLLRRKPNPGG